MVYQAQVLARANRNECSILDLSLLRDALQNLLQLIPPTQEMLEEVEVTLSGDVTEYLKDIEPDMLFQPTAENVLKTTS